MLTISHRGYCREAAENTMKSFVDAVRLGVDGIETDIRMTADGELILFHDRRTADGQAICELVYSELCKNVGFSVPKLEEVLEWPEDILWVLELKDIRALESFLRAVKPYVPSKRLLVISFLHNAIEEVQRRLGVECGVTVAHRPADFQTCQLRRWHTIVWKYEFLDSELIQESIVAGHRNLVYNVDGIDEHRTCFEMGLDGIITSDPLLVNQ